MGKRYLKVVFNDWKNASRDKRELSVAKEMRYSTLVIATTKQGKKRYEDIVDGFSVIRIPTRRYGNGKIAVILGRLRAVIEFIAVARQARANIISGHNYLGLLVGYIVNCSKPSIRAKLIYDSHEFELHQIERSRFRFMLVKMVEGFLARRADINMMVSDSIADEVQKIYHLSERPVVVRNIPNYWLLDEAEIQNIRSEYVQNLDIDLEGTIILYHGGVLNNRKIENIIDSLLFLDNTGLVVLGDAERDSYYESLKQRVENAHLKNRVYFHKSVPITKLCNYVAAADAGLIIFPKELKSYDYSLPNKFFENIQALTPIICNNLSEIRKIIDKYNIGVLVEGDAPKEIAEAVSRLKNDPKTYQIFKHNLIKAKEELCWEVEKKRIVDMINSLSITQEAT